MIKFHKSKFRKIGFFSAIILILFGLISSYAFLHIHIKDDEKIIVHSHPYSQDADKSSKAPTHHNHSSIEYYFYKVSSEIEKYIIIFESDGRQIFEIRQYFNYNHTILPTLILGQLYSLRAPPSC